MYIFDLDGTVVDSSHRYKADETGTVDIKHWRANSTASLIARDKELPLADFWRYAVKQGKPVIVCTARVMKSADYEWLAKHRLVADLILSRNGETDNRSAVQQKVEQLARFAPLKKSVIFFEDCPKIREAVEQAHGFTTFNPVY